MQEKEREGLEGEEGLEEEEEEDQRSVAGQCVGQTMLELPALSRQAPPKAAVFCCSLQRVSSISCDDICFLCFPTACCPHHRRPAVVLLHSFAWFFGRLPGTTERAGR